MGIALLPCYLGDVEPDLVRLGGPELGAQLEVWLVLHKDLRHSARIRACADFLVAAHAVQSRLLAGSATRRRR